MSCHATLNNSRGDVSRCSPGMLLISIKRKTDTDELAKIALNASEMVCAMQECFRKLRGVFLGWLGPMTSMQQWALRRDLVIAEGGCARIDNEIKLDRKQRRKKKCLQIWQEQNYCLSDKKGCKFWVHKDTIGIATLENLIASVNNFVFQSFELLLVDAKAKTWKK